MSTIIPNAHRSEPPAQPAWLSAIVDHNPFFLLSGVCMLLGCFLLSAEIQADPDQFNTLVLLIGVLFIYQLLVLALGLYLARRDMARDAGYLLVLATLLLADVTFLYNQALTANAPVGGAINAAAVVLGLAKVALITRVLGIHFSARAWALIAIDLTVVMALPGLFRTLKLSEALTPGAMYLAWCGVGVLLALHAIEPWRGRPRAFERHTDRRLQRRMHVLLRLVPFASVVAHVAAAHYVFELAWHATMLGPILLGAAVYAMHRMPAAATWQARGKIAMLLGLLAVVASLSMPRELIWDLAWPMSPLRTMLLAAAALWLYAGVRSGSNRLFALSAFGLMLALLGHTPQASRQAFAALIDRSRDWLPTTVQQWGVLAVIAAFVLLAVGAALSIFARPRHDATATNDDAG